MPAVGAGQLELLGLRLKAAGATGLRRNLLAGIRAGAKPLVADVRAAALAQLPKSGGLNEYVASSPIAVRTRLSGPSVGVRIVNTKKGAGSGGIADFGSDRGAVRHPVFGHKDRKWAVTKVTPGWFTKTLEDKSPGVAPDVFAAMELTAREIMRGVV
jgi:hypothetical protein